MGNLGAISDSPFSRFQPGETVLGRFRIVRLLGKGGMGEVFEADDLQLGRIALKAIRSDISTSSHSLGRFRREVHLARKVSGPQVCRIHELFLVPATSRHGATAFLTMEYLDGVTLADRLRKSGPLSHEEGLAIALDICEGLRLIHQQGIVHRDLKSANVMLCSRAGQTRAVVMDFGLAFDGLPDVQAGNESTASAAFASTGFGVIAGTPAYMSPEQFEGKPVSPATDIYALGIVLYEIFTGLQPYAAATPVGAAIRRARRPTPLSSIQHGMPHHFDRVVERCLDYEPESRFQSADQVAKELRTGPLDIHNLAADRPWVLWLVGAMFLVCAAWGGLSWWRTRQYYRPGAQAERWYQTGLASLREASYLKATRELENAIAQDSRFVMAHARLAEAWSNLDFDGTAQREMLVASSGEGRIPPVDRMYLDAIRATLTRDFAGALNLYRKILDRLPESDKAAGYVDLGMAYERAGDPQRALQSYKKASALNSDNPAPYLRAGMLESRLNQVQQAQQAFGRAEALYASEMNPEGLAELDYQRGYLANQREANDEANTYLNRALSDAQRLPSVQLEIRALTQLSSVAYNSEHDTQAVELAQRAMELARDNQLDAWTAEGFVRIANVRLIHQEYSQADDALRDAFRILQQSQQTRVEAMAKLTLASLRNQQGRYKDVLAPAADALSYYKTNGHFMEAARASLLIARAQRSTGELDRALQSGKELVELAKQAGSRELQTLAEDLIGTIYFLREDYPQTLDHFGKAFGLAGEGTPRSWEALHEAQIFLRIGRFADAERMIALTPPGHPDVPALRLEILIGERKYAQAEALAKQLVTGANLPPDAQYNLAIDGAVAEALNHHPTAALAALHTIGAPQEVSGDPAAVASTELSMATVYLAAGDAQSAFENASRAESWYSANHLEDSALRSALIATRAARIRHEPADERLFMQKSLDILNDLRNTWSPQLYLSYTSGPDFQFLGESALHLRR